MLVSESEVEDPQIPLEISISVDEKSRTFTIQDTGIGMTKEELIENLGTIAQSGSRKFVQEMKKEGKSSDAISNIIGQFGVGFYSIFMVANKVRVYTRSGLKGSEGYCWESYGTGDYSIHAGLLIKINLADGVKRGTKIILQLKEDEKEFSIKESVERIIKKYSNFVGFDIKLNGSKVNTQKAIWLQSKSSVTAEEYKEFYKYMTHSSNDPFYTIHFNTDVPMSIHALFYVPDSHSEKLGMGKMDPGVNVYCRKVLIQPKHREILPDWLRFIKGAVDSEDLPLHISREHLQNSPLIRRINGILTRKIIRYFEDMLKQDMKKYITFYEEFNRFFKEGISSDLLYKDEIAKILIFETSNTQPDERITLTDYVNRMPEDQKDIYYLIAPNRAYAESSPYFEAFKSKNIEVLFLFNPVDEFVMTSIGTYNKKSLKSIERTEIQNKETKEGGLTDEQIKELEKWFVSVLNGKLSGLKSTNRLSGLKIFLTLPIGTPAIISNPENPAMRMMRQMYGNKNETLPPQTMEVDPTHPMIKKIYETKDSNERVAKVVAEQLFNNAMITAGLMEDARSMLTTLNSLLEISLEK
jgi:TNF receptor-associated protein 1